MTDNSARVEAVLGRYCTAEARFPTGGDWSDVALAVWLDAAGNAGLPNVTIVSIEVGDPNTQAALVEVAGERFALTVRDAEGSEKEVRAVPLSTQEP